MRPSFFTYIAVFLAILSLVNAEHNKSKSKGKKYDRIIKVNGKDLTRKSIVFDKDTPDVFYCIPSKPIGDKIIVRARPIQKLCEFEGNIPEDYEPDCYKDVDESDYACKEKYRIMMRLYPPGSEALGIVSYNGTKLLKFNKLPADERWTETDNKN